MECASRVVEPRFAGKGGREAALSPPTSEALQPQVDVCARTTCVSEATVPCCFCFVFFFLKKPMEPRSRQLSGPLPPPLRLPLLPSLQSFWFCFEFYVYFFGGCFSPETRLSPDLYCKLVRKRREHGPTRDGEARPAREFRIAAAMQKG